MKTKNIELRKAISVLSSDQEKLKFLRSIYQPGNDKVFNLMLEIQGGVDSNILDEEMKLALQIEDEQKIDKIGQMIIDYYVSKSLYYSLPEILKKWSNHSLKLYLLNKLPMSEDEKGLDTAVMLYKELAPQDNKSIILKKKLLDIQLQNKKYLWKAASLLLELGRYDEAIDFYIENAGPTDIGYWKSALEIAKKHNPDRVSEIAYKVQEKVPQDKSSAMLHLRCSQELGNTEQFEKWIKGFSSQLEINNPPRFYHSLIKVLNFLEMSDKVSDLMSRIESYTERQELNFDKYAYHQEVGEIYLELKDFTKAKIWFARVIDYQVAECHPSHARKTIDEYIDATGDNPFKEKLLILFEREQKYDEAFKLAEELGMRDEAVRYGHLHQIFSEVHSAEEVSNPD